MYKYSPKHIGKKRQPSSHPTQNQIEQEQYQGLLVNETGFIYDDDAPKSVTEESSCQQIEEEKKEVKMVLMDHRKFDQSGNFDVSLLSQKKFQGIQEAIDVLGVSMNSQSLD